MKLNLDKKYFTSLKFIFTAIALVFTLLPLILYATTGATQFNKETLSGAILAGHIVALILLVGSIAMDILGLGEYSKYARVAAYLMMFLAFVFCIVTEINFLGNVFVSTDPVDPIYIVRYLFVMLPTLIAAVLSLVAATHKGKKKKSEKPEEEATENV